MKNNFKKFTAITLSSLGMLTSTPSAFCAPKSNLTKLTPTEKAHETTAPTKCDSELKFSSSTPSAFHAIKIRKSTCKTALILGKKISPKSIGHLVNAKCLEAPLANIIKSLSFAYQTNLEKITFKNVDYLGSYAFINCDKLKEIVFTDRLRSIEANAFLGCKKDVKIIYRGNTYSVPEFLKKVKPLIRLDVWREGTRSFHEKSNLLMDKNLKNYLLYHLKH